MEHHRRRRIEQYVDSADESAEESPYLTLRKQKITRNLARLKELGLLSNPNERPRSPKSPQDNGEETLNYVRRKRKALVRDTAAGMAFSGQRRRSRRLEADRFEVSKSQDPTSKSYALGLDAPIVAQPVPPERTLQKQLHKPTMGSLLPSNSARSIALDASKVLDSFLGVQMTTTGKAHVMNECGRLSNESCTNVSFNKYSGVQEWGNDVFFLWINLDAPQSTVINEFSHGTVAWFGGSRMHDGTPVIAKLKVAQTVLLWCRKYHAKSFGPYVCLGRLSLSSYDPNARPLAFTWKLLDYNKLLDYSNLDNSVLESFGFNN